MPRVLMSLPILLALAVAGHAVRGDEPKWFLETKETEKVADLLKQAEPLCKGDAQQQAQGIALLRLARSVIGE